MDIGGEVLLNQLLDQNVEEQRSNLNISDVIEAISIADPGFETAAAAAPAAVMSRSPAHAPYVRIVEQPASKALRFRYECEGRSAGSIPGVNSTSDRRTYPTIEICGYTGKAIVVVSCVTRDEPYKAHPHNLVGREHCRSGVCTMKADLRESSQVTFSNLGIQCVKRRDIVEALTTREKLRVDPYKNGFEHKNQPQSIDLNAVRICFQVFLDDESGRFRHPLPAVVSDIIFDKKAMSDLQILRISQPSGPVKGGTEVILLCEKVNREDIAVVVYEEGQEQEMNANVIIIHKQVAIAFTMPPYREQKVDKYVDVFIQLKRPSDNARSNSIPYQYIPSYQVTDYLKRKRQKTTMPLTIMEQIAHESEIWKQEQKIKTEQAGTSPVHYTPLESAGENAYQQWPQEMAAGISIAGASNAGYYSPDVAWQGQTFAPQGMQLPNLSPNMQSRSPQLQSNMQMTNMQGQVMSPQSQLMSPQRQVISPHGRVMSPQGHVMSPHPQVMSPQGNVMSPLHQVMSPQGHMMSPHHQVMSPQHQIMSPQHQVISPQLQVMSTQHQVMSPQRQVMSPQHQVMSPQHQVMSPQHQLMSPQGHIMSPQRQVISPHVGQMEVIGDRCAPAQMGHVSPNIDAMAQHQLGMAQAQAQQQAMDTNSGSMSLTNLLAMGGDPMQPVQLNSGELSALLGSVNRGADLSDSLNRLSTSDLLSYTTELQ